MTGKTPNILFIMADQMAPQALPVYGHSQVVAPHIERRADEGVVFENAYCNFPLCVPARMSMLTGRLAHDIGVWDNATELPAGAPTMAHYMRSNGYSATLAGKMHFIGPDQIHGFGERTELPVPLAKRTCRRITPPPAQRMPSPKRTPSPPLMALLPWK